MRRVLPVIFAAALASACNAAPPESGLTYRAGDDAFYLNKRCVDEIRVRDALSPDVFLKLKHSLSCSEALNKIIADNINKELVVTLQQQELLKAKIGSQMKTENGFSQATADKTVARNIYDFYQ
ncbi:hypothetical protein PFH44_22570 [Raoultella sp. Ech2A]|uniref:hypothetical protein n=1 Tax=Raoultella sp. Ech2A TaxID=2996539 RepID=UPI0024C0C888|nr:hypothetical protein [Raoultella sp. Ech2A]MDJ1656243.1 hypothetical protein [Raoultella sp. Ech2A]